MAAQLKKYSRSKTAKIAAYALLIICVCLISILLSEFIYAYNSDLEAVIREEYFNSSTYYNDVDRALVSSYNLLQQPENAVAIPRDYLYHASRADEESPRANFTAAEQAGFSGYMYGWRDGQAFASHVEDGVELPLPWEESGILTFLEGRMAYYGAGVTSDSQVLVMFADALIAARQQAWEIERAALLESGERLLVVVLPIIPLIIYLGMVTGRRPKDEDLHPGSLERLYSEALLLLLLIVLMGGGELWLYFVEAVRLQIYYGPSGIPEETRSLLAVASVIYVGVAVGISMLLFNALIRKAKAGRLWRHSAVYRLLRLLSLPVPLLWRGLRRQVERLAAWWSGAWRLFFIGPEYGGSDPTERLFRRQRRFLIATAVTVVVMIFFLLLDIVALFLLALLAEGALIYYFLRDNRRDIALVRASVENSLDEQMRSEKLKVDLVTNVSHDLKTPLTSIISYVELLSLEDDLNPVARDYVQILSEKSRRLDRIVSDLFELAKATSGNIPLEIELLDLKRLFAQTLADMGDRIEASGLEIRLKLAEQPLLMQADGSKLYRVLQNVLDNALKYSLAGSRVFVELWEEEGRAYGVVKNTSAYEMNFTAEDVLRRFSRGDAARTGEGSGLGLAIAKSFCERCGGRFAVTVDGDQFKAAMDFPLVGRE